jgi:CDP-diacylglycerol--glycerol-3-phosphate 3-phosphatidyltransferase
MNRSTMHLPASLRPDERYATRRLEAALREDVATRFRRAILPVAKALARLGLSANAITMLSLFVAAIGAVAIAFDHFCVAWIAVLAASLGDALDGLIARHTHTETPGGALLDASADRYGELFMFGGLIFLFQASAPALGLVLLALTASMMVSYGSAKAEGFGVAVPPGLMRRPQRLVCLIAGTAFAAAVDALETRRLVPLHSHYLPVFAALGVIALCGNASAIKRLCAIATIANRAASARQGRADARPG